MFSRFVCLLCVFTLFCTLFTACGKPLTKEEILTKLPYKIDYSVVGEKAAKIKEVEYGSPEEAAPIKIESVSLVADRSGSMGRFLGGSLTTYTNVLSALSDVFSSVSLTCCEIPDMNTGGELNIEKFSAAKIEDWRSPDSYTYDGGTDLHAMIKLVIEDMNSKKHAGSLYVIISDITPQPVLGSDNILSSEYQMNEIGKLLVENVILKPGLSVGIVGIQADRAGNLSGLPDKSHRDADGKLQINPFVVKHEDILSQGGIYKSPLYLLLLGDELVVQDSVNKLSEKISERIHPAEGELKSYIVPRITVSAQEKFDDSREDQKITLPSVELADDFAQYAVGADKDMRTEPLSVYENESYDPPRYFEDGCIPFYRLYDSKRSGQSTSITIEASIPYILMLSPENREIPITADFLDMDAAKSDVMHYVGRSPKDEQPDAELQTGEIIERKSLEFIKGSRAGGNAEWRWTLELKPEALRLDEPVLFVTETQIPLKGEKVYDLVSQTISSNAEWLFDDVSEKSWSLDIPQYWAYRENGGQYMQAHKTPYLSTLFRTIRNEIASNISSDLYKKSEAYTRSAMFGFVVRGSTSSYYPGNNKDGKEDPFNIALPNDKINELEQMTSE